MAALPLGLAGGSTRCLSATGALRSGCLPVIGTVQVGSRIKASQIGGRATTVLVDQATRRPNEIPGARDKVACLGRAFLCVFLGLGNDGANSSQLPSNIVFGALHLRAPMANARREL
jgi:hypothetical protein